MNELALPTAPAQFPALYTAARAALFRCDQIDECQEWVNKAAAIASYAQQSRDPTLRDMAIRIQARAARRCGELLNKIPDNPGGHVASSHPQRMATATKAGMSRKQYVQAVAVARIPEKKFERVIESKSPPKLYRLAEMGVTKRYSGGRKLGSRHVDGLSELAHYCETHSPQDVAAQFAQRKQALAVCAWLLAIIDLTGATACA